MRSDSASLDERADAGTGSRRSLEVVFTSRKVSFAKHAQMSIFSISSKLTSSLVRS